MISGSIGFDDFEWGVDLYADDPLVFKKLVYDMRFDEASARFGEFGPFWSGVQFSSRELRVFLDGDAVPALDAGTLSVVRRRDVPVGIGHGRVTNPKHAIASAATPPVMKASSVPPRSHNHPASSEPNGPLARKT